MKKVLFVLGILLPLVAQNQEVSIFVKHQANGPFLVEACTEIADTIYVTREDTTEQASYQLTTQGSATSDDHTPLPTTVDFEVGQSVVAIPLLAIADGINEDRETLIINVLEPNVGVRASIDILILDELEVVIEPSEVFVCQGETVSLTTVIGGTYLWVMNEDTIEASTLEFVASEQTSVKVLASLGDCTSEDEVDIDLRTGITFNVGDTAFICLGDQANITVDIIGNQIGDYTWSPLDTTITVLADQSVQVMPEETQTYYLTFQNSECEVLDSVVVRVDSLPDEIEISIVPEKEMYCPGERVTLFSRYFFPPDFPDIEFLWEYEAAGPLSADTLENFVFTTEDTSYFHLAITNNACSLRDSVLLNVINPPVDLSVTDTTVCPNQPVKVELHNADLFKEFMWSPEQGLSCTDCPDPVIRTPTSGQFTLMAKTKEQSCPVSASVNVRIFSPDVIHVIPDTIVCPGEPVRLSALEANEYEELEWSGDNIDCDKCTSPVARPSAPGFYSVLGVKDDGCLGQGAVQLLTYSSPNPVLIADPSGEQELGTLINVQTGLTTGMFTWFVNGQQIEGNDPSVSFTLSSEGENTVTVEIISEEGCEGSSSITITGKPPHYEIPNAFTPNGDQVNDSFRVLIFGNFTLSDFKVFNRWGQLVFEGIGENGWDGRHDGKNAPADTYAYQAVLELPDGSTRTVRGEVTLLR